MQNFAKYHLLTLIAIFIVSLLFFTVGLQHQEIIRFDSRFYLFAIEMQKYGLSWFPTTYHQPYPDYPATSTAMIVLFAKVFGALNKLTAVLPTAIAAALTLMLTYCIAARDNYRWGIFAICFLLLNVNFLAEARSLSLDMYPTLITTLCFYLLSSRDKPSLATDVIIFGLLLLGFIFRGPIGFIIPTGVICSYYLLNRNIKRSIVSGLIAGCLLLISMCVLIYLAYRTGGIPFIRDVWRMEVAGRLNEKAMPFYFYFVNSLSNYAVSFPAACLVFIGLIYYLLQRGTTNLRMPLLFKLAAWCGVVLIGMSIPGDKKIRYILPMMPAIALLAAYPFIAPANEKYFVYLRKFFTLLFFLTPLLLSIALSELHTIAALRNIILPISYSFVYAILIYLQIINIGLVFSPWRASFAMYSCIVATLGFVFVYIEVVEPTQQFLDQSQSFVKQIEVLRKKAGANLVFYKEHPDGLAIKYVVDAQDIVMPVFLKNSMALQQYHAPAYFVTSQEYMARLSKEILSTYKIITEGNLGHHSIVVFTNIGAGLK